MEGWHIPTLEHGGSNCFGIEHGDLQTFAQAESFCLQVGPWSLAYRVGLCGCVTVCGSSGLQGLVFGIWGPGIVALGSMTTASLFAVYNGVDGMVPKPVRVAKDPE